MSWGPLSTSEENVVVPENEWESQTADWIFRNLFRKTGKAESWWKFSLFSLSLCLYLKARRLEKRLMEAAAATEERQRKIQQLEESVSYEDFRLECF